MAKRKPRQMAPKATVTVYRKSDGAPVEYPKHQVHRIKGSETFTTTEPKKKENGS